ncbi:MAG: polysaccharide export protein EpsE [Rubrivivax sp.]
MHTWLLRALAALVLFVAAGASALAQSMPAAQAAAAPEYRIGPGDLLRIGVYQNPDLSLETRVTDAGTISFPLLGAVRVGGMSVTAAERVIADGLRAGNFVRQPQVTIAVTLFRAHQASVLGAVQRPGRFALESLDLRLSDLLAMAGGIAPFGADAVVLLGNREGRPVRIEIDLPSLFSGGASRERDPLVLNGDTIWVERQPVVYIYGEVQRPGPMRLERGMTLMQALATGGGLTPRGTERGIRVHRKVGDGRVQAMQLALDDRVQDGDVIQVRESLF